jgi:cholesterol oxidase
LPSVKEGAMPTERPSLTTREAMKGYFTFGEWPTVTDEDYQRAFLHGRRTNTWILTEFELSTDDLPAFLADPNHPMHIGGSIRADTLWGRAEVDGTLGLFMPTENPALRRLEYLFTFDGGDEGRLTLAGFKEVTESLLSTVLLDQQILYCRVFRGEIGWDAVDTTPAYGVGIMNLHFWDFIKLNIFGLRFHGPHRLQWGARWLRFFLGANIRFTKLKATGRRN